MKTRYCISQKCTQHEHLANRAQANLKVLVQVRKLEIVHDVPKIHSNDTLTWLIDWLKACSTSVTPARLAYGHQPANSPNSSINKSPAVIHCKHLAVDCL